MASTKYSLASVPLAYCRLDWPLRRGVDAPEITLVQPIKLFSRLDQAIQARKGIVDLDVECSRRAGTRSPRGKYSVRGIRMLDYFKRTDGTCIFKMTDARAELEEWICKRDLNLLFRDGYLDGTRQPALSAALPYLLFDVWHLFAPDALKYVGADTVPDGLLYSGATLRKPLADLLSRFGISLGCGRDNRLRFPAREDLGKSPIRGKYTWLRGREPGWLVSARVVMRRARKLRYYYKRKCAMLAEFIHDRNTATSGYLRIKLTQVYSDGDTFLTLEELLKKYEPALVGVVDDAMIGRVFMSENFEDSPMARNGSANRSALIRIIKNDWRRLYKVEMTDSKVGLGAFSELQVGVFKVIVTPDAKQLALGLRPGDLTGDILPAGAIRGEWAEFLNVLTGAPGGISILGLSSVVNHLKTGAALPTAPYTASWEGSEANAIIRLRQEKLADNNYAVLAKISNVQEMTVTWVPARVVQTPQGPVATRFGLDAPARSKAKLQPTDAIALLVGTQRLPNDGEKYEMIELEGYPDGDIAVQEFEVPELPALYDYPDPDGRTGAAHPIGDPKTGRGQLLNKSALQADAEKRRELLYLEKGRPNEGEGVAIGAEAFVNEELGGSIDSITLQLNGVAVTTAINCANLANDQTRQDRAKRRAEARRMGVAGKILESI